MKTLFVLLLLSIAARAEVRFCEELKSRGDVTVVICPQTLGTLEHLGALGHNDGVGALNVSLKTANAATTGYRVTVTYFRSATSTEPAIVVGFLDAGKVGEYATLQLVTGQVASVKSIEVVEIPPSVPVVFGE